MNAVFMNSKNSKTSNLHWLLLSLTEKINLKRNDKYVALSNLILYYTSKNIKTTNLKYQLQRGMKNLNYLMAHIVYPIFKIILNVS